MKIGVLTSSRADYGMYVPLLKALKADPFFEVEIIAFGTHLSEKFGYTVKVIEQDGFNVKHRLETMPTGNNPVNISNCIGTTISSFSSFWANTDFDLVFAFGDRYEMFAAVTAGLPLNINFAHLYGGETTTGAIDDAFRHCITHMSAYHFTSTEVYKKRVIELKGSDKNVYNIGSLAIDNFKNLQLLTKDEFRNKFNINLNIPSLLITFHPETVSFNKNEEYIDELIAALKEIKNYQYVITMPNADTMGNIIREKLNVFISNNSNAIGVESFGSLGYLSCMKHCSFMLGNTSSGFMEASFFPKYVVNLGNRQDGRIITPNILNCPIEKNAILGCIKKVGSSPELKPLDTYGKGDSATKIIEILKQLF